MLRFLKKTCGAVLAGVLCLIGGTWRFPPFREESEDEWLERNEW